LTPRGDVVKHEGFTADDESHTSGAERAGRPGRRAGASRPIRRIEEHAICFELAARPRSRCGVVRACGGDIPFGKKRTRSSTVSGDRIDSPSTMSTSALGWIDLAPAALRRLRQDLAVQQQGVLDEMGMLAIHVGYADHFFPGTSVLHQNPRYLFFTCWNYLMLDSAPGGGATAGARKDAAERWVRDQLVKAEQKNVIGKQVDTPAQPPDASYWSALRRWGFYKPNGPDRSVLLARWQSYRVLRAAEKRTRSEDVEPDRAVWFKAPEPPWYWFQLRPREPVTFDLTHDEAEFLLERLEQLGPKVLLAVAARNARRRLPTGDACWNDDLVTNAAHAVGEGARLVRARYASALAHVIRAIYGALVERRRAETSSKWERQYIVEPEHYRRLLRELVQTHVAGDALRIDPALLASDVGISVSPSGGRERPDLLTLVTATLDALRRTKRAADVDAFLLSRPMHALYEAIESARKGTRARLPDTVKGLERRRTFDHETLNITGLDFRWYQVKTLLSDLGKGLRA
jgi:hypothetical protein